MRGCLVFGVCHVLSCLLRLVYVLIFLFCFVFCFVLFFVLFFVCLFVCFFETDHAVHGLSQVALCVYSRGRVGFFGVGWDFCCYEKKIWVCCHVQVYVQLYDALIYISMPA